MIKKLAILSTLVLICSAASTQSPYPTPEEVEGFYKTETLVVLENTLFSSYNSFIKGAMEEHWKITPFRFITVGDFDKFREDPAYSFIVLTNTRFDKDKSGSVYNFMNLLLGKDVGRIEDMPEMCAIPLSYSEEADVEYSYKVGIVLRFIQAHVRNLTDDPEVGGKRYLKYYNKFVPDLGNKTILLNKTDLVEELRSEATLKDLYDKDIRMVDEEEIKNAVLSRKENTLVLHMVGPESDRAGGMCFKMLIGTDDGLMYFYGEHKISPKNQKGLLVNDLKRIGRF